MRPGAPFKPRLFAIIVAAIAAGILASILVVDLAPGHHAKPAASGDFDITSLLF